jgi:hypothetical protein
MTYKKGFDTLLLELIMAGDDADAGVPTGSKEETII